MFRAVLLALGTTTWLLASGCTATAEDADGELASSSEEGAGGDVVSDEGLGSSADALEGAAAVGATVYTTADVNFRQAPNGTILREIPRNTAVVIVTARPSDGFYNVRHNGTEGYVHGALLTGSRTSGRRITANAVYLGSCEFLGNCASSDTRTAWRADRTIYFGCDGRDTCSDSEAYISVPRNGIPCGATVKICKTSDPSRCIAAKVREKSDSNQRYELSVATALGLGYQPEDGFYPSGGDRECNGAMNGDGRVTIQY